MSHKPEEASELYRQFRTLHAKDRDTSDAVESFSRHLGTEQTHQSRIDKVIAAIPDNQVVCDPSQRNFLLAAKQWLSLWGLKWVPTPAQRFVALGLCGFIAVGLLVNQKPYPWDTFVPTAVIEAGLTGSQIEAIGGSAQMGFTPSGHELAAHYLLGKICTQLALSMALEDESALPYFAASYKRLSSAGLSPAISQQVEALGVQLTDISAHQIGKALAELKQVINEHSQHPLNGFVLGQHMESLRLALEIAKNQDNIFALEVVSADVAELHLDKWQSNELPKLNGVLVQIHNLVQGNLSLSEQRQLMQFIQQLDVLLA